MLKRIEFSTDYNRLKKAEYIIENVPEKWNIKKEVFTQVDRLCPPATIFASDTSAIPITRIASVTNRADKVIGVHFMNPVPLINFAEIIRGCHTSDETVEVTMILLKKMGKDFVVVHDSPGFVSNRILMLTINEAIFLVQEKVASVEEIDTIFKKSFGHKMGPLETADLIGLDTILNTIEVLYNCFNDRKYRPCPILKKMVNEGLYGRKSGQGFYKYK
jgi:3-hydroxybutyryl-CoA dehydrogenase